MAAAVQAESLLHCVKPAIPEAFKVQMDRETILNSIN